jgi:NADH-quinone oxidoreductase subunit J
MTLGLADILFYVFAALTLGCAFLVVANPFSRNPVTSAMFLVLTMVWLAGLFVLLQAFFLAAVQIVVYAGAVMVLFLFVIMLLDLKEEARRRFTRVATAAALISVGMVGWLLIRVLRGAPEGALPSAAADGSVQGLGTALFMRYLLPFEIVSVLLLVAVVGVVLLSKKELR